MGQVENDALLCVGEVSPGSVIYACNAIQCCCSGFFYVACCMLHDHSDDYYDMRFEIILRVQLTIVNKLTKSKIIP